MYKFYRTIAGDGEGWWRMFGVQDEREWVNVSSGTDPVWVVQDKGPLNGCVCVCSGDGRPL